jgi:hypothetical protein
MDRDQLVESAAQLASLGEKALGYGSAYCCPVQVCRPFPVYGPGLMSFVVMHESRVV